MLTSQIISFYSFSIHLISPFASPRVYPITINVFTNSIKQFQYMSFTYRENQTCHFLHEKFERYISVTTCPPQFDRSLCWEGVKHGNVGYRECPFNFCQSLEGCSDISKRFRASRYCNEWGQWNGSDYGQCLEILKDYRRCVSGFCQTCPDMVREAVINVSLTLSVISVGLLVAALILFSIFDSIQCRRLSIHKNLAIAFVFRFTVLALWNVANVSHVFKDCTHYNPLPIKSLEWLCKTLLWLVVYFQVSSVIWMLIEGIYLLSRFTVFAMRSEAPYFIYLLCGWGFPFVIVMIWTIVHEQYSTNNGLYCWLPYGQGSLWILSITMGAALLLNVAVLLAIIVILIQKLQTENTAESKKIWTTVKATILLVPLLGVSNIPLFYEPAKPTAIYMLLSAILQHSQGIFIAVLYCFCNGQIQGAIKRKLTKLPFISVRNRLSHRVRFETERTYVPNTTDTNVNQRHGVQMEELNHRNNELTIPSTTTTTATNNSNNNSYSNPTVTSPQDSSTKQPDW